MLMSLMDVLNKFIKYTIKFIHNLIFNSFYIIQMIQSKYTIFYFHPSIKETISTSIK
jgi:hypothetical protein